MAVFPENHIVICILYLKHITEADFTDDGYFKHRSDQVFQTIWSVALWQ